ncbi:hypothetical protein [Acuticoccus sediminis]|uniref:hypothetical protein n=1 Tax=Acuticoccus sediminis TaxID=2184697 RepID=UPI000DAB6D3F|nr:hypothetical protein [Acuticoccus sediminis]
MHASHGSNAHTAQALREPAPFEGATHAIPAHRRYAGALETAAVFDPAPVSTTVPGRLSCPNPACGDPRPAAPLAEAALVDGLTLVAGGAAGIAMNRKGSA